MNTKDPSPSAVTGGVTLLPCPCGAMVDEDECPYPHNRESTLWKIQCVNGDCGWFAIGNSADDVIRQWSRRAPLATGNLDYQRTEQFANGLPAALSAQPAKGADGMNALHKAVERAAAELPEGYVVALNVERGAAWVNYFIDGEGEDIDSADMNLAEQINHIVDIAMLSATHADGGG